MVTPMSPLTRKPVISRKFSPFRVISLVVPRWNHSREMAVMRGADWAAAHRAPNAASRQQIKMIFLTVFLAEQAQDRFGLNQFARLIEVIEDHRVRINPQRMVDRGQDLHGMDRV